MAEGKKDEVKEETNDEVNTSKDASSTTKNESNGKNNQNVEDLEFILYQTNIFDSFQQLFYEETLPLFCNIYGLDFYVQDLDSQGKEYDFQNIDYSIEEISNHSDDLKLAILNHNSKDIKFAVAHSRFYTANDFESMIKLLESIRNFMTKKDEINKKHSLATCATITYNELLMFELLYKTLLCLKVDEASIKDSCIQEQYNNFNKIVVKGMRDEPKIKDKLTLILYNISTEYLVLDKFGVEFKNAPITFKESYLSIKSCALKYSKYLNIK